MNWGNAFVVSACDGVIEMKLHLEGDFKKTKKKVSAGCSILILRMLIGIFGREYLSIHPFLTPRSCIGCRPRPTSTVCCLS